MVFGDENGRKRLEALTSVRARDDFEAVSFPKATGGANNPGHRFRLDP
jgi:hypothetical protein